MTLKEFYKKAIQTGIDNDPRGKKIITEELEDIKKTYNEMKDKEKEYFDLESLENPYPDTAIHYNNTENALKSIMVGIDIEGSELMIAKTLKTNGRLIDAVIGHHPEGIAFAKLHGVIKMQADILALYGVPINIAEGLIEPRIKEVQRRLMPSNHFRTVDAAKLLDIPLMNVHTPADNMVVTYLQSRFNNDKPYKLGDIIELLMELPEYKDGRKNGFGPEIILGSKDRKAGNIFVDMTGGTSGSKDIFQTLAASKINTIVGMHIGDEHRKEAEKYQINYVIAGHISSDNLGMNLLLDNVLVKENIDIIECSGFRRFKR
ncbi:MAG: NGG1p interacting factor NIF3 [Nitrospirae bacterium]|nr:NGG1p interacting factor NIF3 [Nitrospirota bacterium]